MGSRIETRFSTETRSYTGVELRPHFLLQEFGLKGSALAAFIGPCDVKTEHLVDWEDRLARDRIEARMMVHFLGEFFGMTLREGVLLQRLAMAEMAQLLNSGSTARVIRQGDDLFVKDRKLSVSIVTASPVSVLFHAGINIDPAGAPVPTIGLQELGVDPGEWAGSVLREFAEEWAETDWACAKVRPML